MTPITKDFIQCDFCINRIDKKTCKSFLSGIPDKFLKMLLIHDKKVADEKFIFEIDLKKMRAEL